jgi:chromosome segregation ATPase
LEGELENSKLQVEQYADAVSHAEEVARSQAESFEGEKHSLIEEIDMLRGQLAQESDKVAQKEVEVKRAQDEHKALSSKHEKHIAVLSTKESSLSAKEAELSTKVAELAAKET